jgi:hypothetical protein
MFKSWQQRVRGRQLAVASRLGVPFYLFTAKKEGEDE